MEYLAQDDERVRELTAELNAIRLRDWARNEVRANPAQAAAIRDALTVALAEVGE